MPDLAKSIAKIRKEMPDQANTPIEPQGFFGRMFTNPQARATASPWTGNVSYNPEAMSQLTPDQADNVFTHELTHSRQVQQMPYLQRLMGVGRAMIPGMEENYWQRPRELEAYQAEKDRSTRLGLPNMEDPISGARDIELPAPSQRRKVMSMFVNDRTGGR